MTNNIEQTVQNSIKEKLVQASTEKTLTEITQSTRMGNIVHKIIHKENTQFKSTFIKKLMKEVLPAVTPETREHLTSKCLLDLDTIQTDQEQLNGNLRTSF